MDRCMNRFVYSLEDFRDLFYWLRQCDISCVVDRAVISCILRIFEREGLVDPVNLTNAFQIFATFRLLNPEKAHAAWCDALANFWLSYRESASKVKLSEGNNSLPGNLQPPWLNLPSSGTVNGTPSVSTTTSSAQTLFAQLQSTSLSETPQVPKPQVVTANSYGNTWTPHMNLVSRHRFVDWTVLFQIMTIVERMRFSIDVERDAARETLERITPINAPKQTSRFPAGKCLVDLSFGSIASHYQRMLSSLDFSERSVQLEVAAGGADSRSSSTVQDRHVVYRKAIDSIKGTLSSHSHVQLMVAGIFDQESFEKHYNLTWT